MALPFKTYATIGDTRYRIFKPKEMPEAVFAYDTKQKTAHRIDDSVLKLLKIDKATFRPYNIPNVLMGMKAGQMWNQSWYQDKYKEKGPVKAIVETKVPELESVKWPDYKTFSVQKGYALVREKDTQEVYTLDPKTGQARWLTAEAVRPAGFDLTKVQEVPQGYVKQFKIADKWTKPKTKADYPSFEKSRELSGYQEKKEEEVKRWGFETRAKSAKAISGYADFLLSPVSFKTYKTTQAFIAPKPKDITKDEAIGKRVADYSVLAPEEKDRLDKQFMFEPIYGKKLIEQSNIEIQKIVSEEKQKAGFIDSETGEDKFPVALSIEQAIKEIEASNVVLTDLERLAIVKGKERLDVLREAGTYEGTFETLAKELERIEIEIVFESTKDSPDEDKMKSFEVQYKDKQKEVEKLQTKYKPLVAKLSTYNKELEEIEAKFENERARFTGDKMPTSWANYFALLEYNSNMDTRIKEWLKVEQKGIIQLYETGEINKLTAIELLNNSIPDPNLQFTNKSFDELIMPATKRRREQVLKYKITELGMSADELTTSWNVGKDYLKKSLKMAGKILWKGAELYAADLTIPFQLLQDAKEFKGMSMSLDALIEGLPSLEEVKKMSVNQRRIYLDSLVFISETADKTLADTPKLGSQKAEFLYMVKSIADKAWNPDWSEVDLYKAFEGDSWVPKEYQTQAKIAFGAALMFGLWKQGVWRHSQKNNAIYINLFKDINNKLASTKAPGWVGIKKDYGLAKYTGEALKNTLGKSFSTIANNKYGIPNVNNIITNAFAKSWPKIFPEGSKLGIKKIVTRSEIASQKQIDNIQKLFDNFTPTKEAREKLRKIMALEIVPDETYYKMTAPLIKNVSISNKISKTLEPLANQARKRKESSFIKLFPQIKANEELIITINKIKKNHPTDLLFKQLKNKPNTLAAELFKKYPKEVSTDLNNFLKKIRIKDLKSGDRLVVEAGLVPEHIKILKYSIKDLPFKTTDEVITFFKEANKGTRKIKVAVQSESAAAFEILSVLDPSLYGEIRKLVNLGLDIKKVPLVLRELAKGGKLKAEAKFIQEAKLMGEGVEKWLEPFVIELRMSSKTFTGREKYLAYLRESQSKSVVDRIIKLEGELKSFYDRVRNIEGKLGKPVRIPWAKVKGVESYTWMLNEKEWRSLKLPERAAGISDVLNGSKILAKISGIKAFGNPNKTFAVNFVRRGKALTIEDVSAVSFHENIHTIINFKSSNFYKGKPLNDFLIKNLERRISRNPELQRVLDTIAKVYFKNEKITPKIKERIMHEFYAFMIESSLAVKLNLRLRLRTIERISTQEKAELARAQNTFIKLAKKNQLLTPEERLIFFPQRLAEKQKRLIIKQYGRKNGDEMIDILEGGLEIDSTKIPYFEPYRKGYVEIKNPMIIKVQDKIMNHDIPRLMPGYQLPRINKKLDPYELVPGLMRSISRRMKDSKAEDFARVAKKMGYKDAKAIKLYTNNAIKTGVFPRINPIVYEFQSNPNAFINAIRQGHARRAQNIAKKQINKYLKKQVQKPYYNDQQKTAIEKWRRQFMGDAPIKDGSVKDTLSSLGLYKDISGVEATFLYDLQIVGGGKVYISGPLWLKNLGTGAWKSKNPEAASVFRGVMTVLNLPQTLWKYSVLFLRPGWGVRNIMDNSLKMGIATESGQKAQSWKMIAASMTPLGWKKVRRELQAATGIGKQFESTTMFVSENPTFNNQAMKALSFWLMDRTGAFGKYANRAFQTFLKKKRGLENIYTQTEVLAKEALMYNAVFKYADDAVKTLWDDIAKMQNTQKNILLELRSLVPGKKNYNKISAIAQKVMEGKLTKVDEKWILAMAKKYKMKDGAILEKGFKEVTRVLFDYSDLSKVGKALRWIYPFWGFFSKNFILWTETVAKNPGLRKAATFYLKKIEQANSDLPDWYKRRTKIFGDWYTLPFFSYQQVADVWLDPYKEFVAWTENANHPISGLGWNPSISVAIKKFTGKGYFSSEKDLKSLGYTDEMLRRMGQENINLEKNNNVWAIYARQIPIFQLISTFQTATDEMLNTIDSAVGSKKMNAFSSYFFGVPIIKIDDLNKLWGAYNRMLPQDRTKFLAALPEGQYENFYKLLAVKNLQKILDATAAGIKDPIYYQYMYDWQYRNEYFRILEIDGSKQANYYLANNKVARLAVERYWDILEYSPKRAATEYIYNKNQVRGVVYEILKQLNSELQKGMETRPAEWYAITGEGYEVAYTKEDLERDLLNEDGTVKPETLEELQAMMPELKKLPWLKKLVEESISKSQEFPEEYHRLVIETNKEEEDFIYAIEMMTFGKTIYIASDVPSTEQARGAALRAGYNLWDNMSDTTKAIHLERYPAKNIWHEFKSSYTKKLGVMTSQNQIENWYENFYNDKFFGSKDREVYFIKLPCL